MKKTDSIRTSGRAIPLRSLVYSGVLTMALSTLGVIPVQGLAGPTVDVEITETSVVFSPVMTHDGAVVTLSGDDYDWIFRFDAYEVISISVYDEDGQVLADGSYSWQLELLPEESVAAALALATSEANNSGGETIPWPAENGSISVLDGQFALLDIVEPGANRSSSSASVVDPGEGTATAEDSDG